MKPKKIAFTLATGLLLAATGAQAQVEINISGGVAFRSQFYTLIRNLYGASLTTQNPADGPNAPLALKVTWTGTIPSLYGGQTVTVRAFYNGAVLGIRDLTQNSPVAFLASTPGDTNVVSLLSDIGYSSVFQNTTEFQSPTLESHRFAVAPFFFLKSTTAPATLTNITSHQLKTLWANGALPAWFFTGNTNDTQTIYGIIREPSSGQRLITFRDAVFSGAPLSYFWNTNTSTWVNDPAGRNSNQIITHLNNYGPAISYLAQADAFSVNAGQNVLRYNGVLPFIGAFNSISNNWTPVINGQYSLWYYEQLFTRTTASANVKNFRDSLLTRINTLLQAGAPYTIPLSQFRVERSSDGAPVAPLE